MKRTGIIVIFFPVRWVSVTLSEHQSVLAADIVNQFLEDHPSYSPRLRLKTLQAADGLFRAAEILSQ
ncbi:MAG: hypothetical protein QF842_03370 [Candidatus Marinimicrobia bacterium]|jgi:aminopeptidase N|nr:hypothetical protein [Candidatus Neomarinimicrobiota bacterium]|tara:strand:- start:17764 stop:17964 length:201 start_codon:yes stop_codon:yes gene_type:complete